MASLSVGILAVLALWALISTALGIAVLRRSTLSRVLLVISAGVCAGVTALLALPLFLPGVWTLTSIAVIVLFFAGAANEWFSG